MVRQFFVAVVVFSVLSPFGLAAAPESWSAAVGIGGTVAPGAWTPLRITVPAGAGPWTLQVFSVSVSGRVSDPVVFGHPAGGEFEEPLFLSDAVRVLKMRFLEGDLVQQEFDLPLAGRLFPGHLIGVDGVGPPIREALSEVLLPREPVRVIPAPPADWPRSPLSYGGLAALVAADPGPILSPAQRTAVRAWIGSGGRLVVINPRPGTESLVAQIGPVPGWGKVTTVDHAAPSWQKLLALGPYGEARLLGTDFEPAARDLPTRGTSLAPAAAALLLVWAVTVTLVLVLRRRRGLGPALAAAVLGSAAAVILWSSGDLGWDQGLPIHGREVVLPGDLGRFASLEAVASTRRSGPFEWPAGSPWALARWKAALPLETLVKTSGPDEISVGAYLPPLDRPARYRVRWDGSQLRWSENTGTGWTSREEGPAELGPDGPWLARMTARLPVAWSVGLDGNSCWLRPEPEGAPL